MINQEWLIPGLRSWRCGILALRCSIPSVSSSHQVCCRDHFCCCRRGSLRDAYVATHQLVCLHDCEGVSINYRSITISFADSLPISASVTGGASQTRNISLDSYTVGDSIPLECVVEACRPFDYLTVEWINPEGTVMDEHRGKFAEGEESFSYNLPVRDTTQRGPYQCRVWTSLRGVNYTTASTFALQGVCIVVVVVCE